MRAFDPEQLPTYQSDLDIALQALTEGSRRGDRPLDLEHVEVRGIVEGSGIKLSKYSRMLLDRERKARAQPKVTKGKRKMGRKRYRHWQRLRIKRERLKANEYWRWRDRLELRGYEVLVTEELWDDWVQPLIGEELLWTSKLYSTGKKQVSLWDFYILRGNKIKGSSRKTVLWDGAEEYLKQLEVLT